MRGSTPVTTDIVLVGGGHAHVHVLAAFAMKPEPGVRVTLVTRDLATPYSGMLPGVIAGLYTPEQAHIDLVRLAAATGTRLIHADAIGLDRAQKRVLLEDRASLAYDLVSIDIGITPSLGSIAGAEQHAIAVKPIGSFLNKVNMLIDRCQRADGPRRIAVIGGGAGGVELLLSLRTRLVAQAAEAERDASDFSFALVTDGEILATHNNRVRETFRRALTTRDVALYEHRRVARVNADVIELECGTSIRSDATLIATQAAAPPWFAETGLALDGDGFLAVGPTLQVQNDPDVFAAGDCATLVETPREKAGVFAVRAGPPLARNLRLRARGQAPRPWRPQRRHLALISTGERYAVASRGAFKAEGAWLWTLKDRIDRRWMRMYQDTDRLTARMSARTRAHAGDNEPVEAMRCGGCAAKVGPRPLSRALARLGPGAKNDIVVGLEAPDDAAVLRLPSGAHLVQTVDFFRAFVDDPYVFGEIAANHALNDIFAMGGTPRYVLANAVVPHGPGPKVEEDLFQMLAGARACLDRENVTLIGGHSSEGPDLSLGFSVTGAVAPDRIVRKGGLKAGDALILTRPIGTGILFAAAMRARAKAAWIEAAIAEMRCSNRAAAGILLGHGTTAMTDVTGFGFVGHLGEMMAASGAAADLDLDAIPVYDGALELALGGVTSTLLPENLAAASLLQTEVDAATRALLFDPQTSGGLLAGVPGNVANRCIAGLLATGYVHAAVIGHVGKVGLPASEVSAVASGRLGSAGVRAADTIRGNVPSTI